MCLSDMSLCFYFHSAPANPKAALKSKIVAEFTVSTRLAPTSSSFFKKKPLTYDGLFLNPPCASSPARS